MIGWLIKLTGSGKWAHLIIVLAAAVLVATLCAKSYSAGYKAADQKALVHRLRVQQTQLSNENSGLKVQLQTTIDDATTKLNQLESLRHEHARLTQSLAAANQQQRGIYRTLRSQAAELTAARAVDSASGPQCQFDDDFVRVWNAALDPNAAEGLRDAAGLAADAVASTDSVAGNTTFDRAGGHSALGAAINGTNSDRASVSASDLLANHLDNRELDSAIRNQCSALIEFHQQHDPQ